MRPLWTVLLVVQCGCAADPKDALVAYAAALRANDAQQVWLLSDASFRRAHDPEQVAAYLRAHPEEVGRLLRALDGAQGTHATIELGDGGRLSMVMESGGWRVRDGGLVPFDADTPEAALVAFFRGVESGRLGEVRAVMPDEFAARFAQDEALRAHLSSLAARIEAARSALTPIRAQMAEIDGDRAWIRYGRGKKAELVRQQDRWRVVDLE